MKVAVTGARGMLGQAVVAEFANRGDTVAALSHADLDITDCRAVFSTIRKLEPEVVVNCAAYTDVDRAESEPERAMLVNGLGVRNIALVCKEIGATVVHISTDYVFGGDKEGAWGIYDERRPINAYGRSKLYGERFLETVAPRYYLVRTSWLFGPGGKNFVDTILRLARENKELAVVNDQRGCPTYSLDLARAVARLIAAGCPGVYHITNRGAATRYEFARVIVEESRLAINVRPIPSGEYPTPAKRPPNSVLGLFPLPETIDNPCRCWQDAVREYVAMRTNVQLHHG